jgi:hypothetical protein
LSEYILRGGGIKRSLDTLEDVMTVALKEGIPKLGIHHIGGSTSLDRHVYPVGGVELRVDVNDSGIEIGDGTLECCGVETDDGSIT